VIKVNIDVNELVASRPQFALIRLPNSIAAGDCERLCWEFSGIKNGGDDYTPSRLITLYYPINKPINLIICM